MAKADTVYSLFGMKSPYEVAQEQMQASRELLARQQDPYARLGTALGIGLGRAFGGEDPRIARSKQFGELYTQARSDVAQENETRQKAQQEALDRKLGGLEGAILSEQTGRGNIPDVQPIVTKEDEAVAALNERARTFDALANRLSGIKGFESQVESAKLRATEARVQALAAKKELAQMRKYEAEAQSKSVAKAPTTRTRIEGDKKIVEEWTGTGWKEVSSGRRYKPQEGATGVVSEKMAEQTVKKFGEYETQLQGARQTLNNLQTMENLLDEDIITGPFANSRVAVEKALAQAGIIDGTRIANTEAFLAAAAKQTIALLGTGALGAGTGISDKDREFMEKAEAGNISLSEQSIRDIIRINRQVAQQAFTTYNKFIGTASQRFPDAAPLFGSPQFFIGQTARNPETGKTAVYTANGWVVQ